MLFRSRRELVALMGEHDGISLTASGALDAGAGAAAALDGVTSASPRPGGIDVVAADASALLPGLLAALAAAGVQVTGVDVTEPDLEAVFLHLTGKALRD